MELTTCNTFGDRVKWVRLQHTLTLQAFADRIGFDKSYVSRIEAGKAVNPTLDFISAISKEFGVSHAWLIDGSGKPGLNAELGASNEMPEPLYERIEDVLCCVQIVRILMADTPPLKALLMTQDIFKQPELTAAAKIFWSKVFLRALIASPGTEDPLVIDMIKQHHQKKKAKD